MTASSRPFQSRIPNVDSRTAGIVLGEARCRFLLLCLCLTLFVLAWHLAGAGPALAVPLPAGYVQCGTENGTNNCPSGRIAYGALNEYVLRDVTAPFACSNATFGDPVYGVVKGCYAGTATPASISVTPTSLAFTGTVGGANPAAQTVALTNAGGGTLSWTVSENAAWLTVSPLSGTTTTETDTLTAAVNISGLAAGTYNGVITVTASGGSRTISATLTVSAAASTSPVPLPAGHVQCGTENGANTCPSGRIAYGAQNRFYLRDVTAPFSCSNATFGDPIVGVPKACYAGGGGSVPAALSVTPTSLAFTGTVGGANPAARTVALTNTGGGTLSWTVSDNAAWLTVSPVSGTTTTETDTLTATINISGLAAGTYNGVITVTASGGSRSIAVTLTLSAASSTAPVPLPAGYVQCATENGANTCPSGRIAYGAQNRFFLRDVVAPFSCSNTTFGDPIVGVQKACYAGGSGATGITAIPTSLAFTGTVGGANPASRTIALTNTGGGTLSWTVSDNAAWLTVSPVSGTTTTETDTLTAAINTSGLAAGTYNGIITVTPTGSTPRQIPVSVTLTAGGTGTATLTWTAGTETDLAGYRVYWGTASGTYGAAIATLDRTVTSYVSSGLQAGTTYFFVITAVDNAGNESTFSNEVSKSIY